MIRDIHRLTHPDEAEKLLRSFAFTPKKDTVPLAEAAGRVLAEEITCPYDSPPFSKAAMDGYALRPDDDASGYRCVGTVAAGDTPSITLEEGECAKIMTGAPLPGGAGRVIRVEYTREENGVMIPTQRDPSRNIILKGSNRRKGETAMGPKRLSARDVGVLASYGIARVPVAVPPRVAVIPTGTELQVPGHPLIPGQIYNSNSYQLEVQTAETGCPCTRYGIVSDDPGFLENTILTAMAESEVLILSGGVSMGDYDFIPDMIRKTGAEIFFHGLAIKPGKPTLFGKRGNTFIFGMPGNPVSTFVIFEVLVKPFLFRMMGIEQPPVLSRGTTAETIRRKTADRVEFLPVRIEGGIVTPLPYHGSSNLDTLAEANALLRLEQGEYEYPKGTETDGTTYITAR